MAENNGKYTNWKKEFGKSVKFAAKDVLTDLAPATVGSARNIAADIRELRQTLRKMAQNQGSINGMVGQQTGEETKLINDAVKNLKDSLETGQFYSEERAKAADPFSNFDTNFNFDDSSSFTNPMDAVAASIGSQTSRGVKQINSSLEKSTETLAEGFSVLNRSEKHSFILNAALQKRFHSESLEQFKAMNENLGNLVRFNNETNATFVTASMKFYDDSLEELRAIRKGIEVISTQKEIEHDQYTSSDAANVFDERGRFSLKNYITYVKKNFSSGTAGGSFGIAKMLLNPMFAGEYAANPAHHLLKLGISSMLPKRLTRRITNFDKDMGEYLPALLTGLGEGDGLLSSFLKKFALKNKAGRNNYSPNEFNRGPMAFNGEANKAITEIIPDFLSRILFSIDSMRISVQKNIIKGQMRGMASDSAEYKELQNQIANLGEAQQIRFDWSNDFVTGGRYVTQDVLEKRIKQQRRKAALSGLRDTREEIERASTMLYGRGTDQDTNIRERIDDVLEAIVKGQIDFFGKPNEERLNLVKKYAYNNKDNYPRDEAIEVLGFMNGLSRRAKMNIKGMGTIRGREALNEYWHEYNQAPGSNVDMRNAHNENNGIYNVSTEGSVEYYANNEWLGIYRKPGTTSWKISDKDLDKFNKFYGTKCKDADDCIAVIGERDKKRGTGMMSNIPAEITDPNMRVNYMQYMMAKREKEYRYGIEDDTGSSGSFFGKIKALFNTPITFLDKALNKIDDTIYSLTFGENGIVSEFKNGLTGKVDEKSGKYEGGLFSEVFNGMKAVGDAAAESVKKWLPEQVKGLGSIVRQYFFGPDEVDKDGKPVEKEPIMSRLAAKVQLQFSAWSSALFGGSADDKTGEDGKPLTKQEIIKKASESFKKAIPTIGKGMAAGAGLGVISGLGGFGVLGSLFLPGGPIGGAIVGGALGLLSRSKAFMDTMFGEETTDEKGNKSRKGGIIPKGFMDWFKKFKIPLVGGAAVGTLSHMLGHGIAFGMMPTIAITAFGPVLAGAAWGLASHSEAFREAIFGKESLNEDGTKKRIGGLLNNAIMRKIKNVIPKGIAGGLTGVAGMGVLSQMGIVGSALALGPIPAAIGGAALGIASASKNFTRAFFGYTDKKGGYHSGALDKIKNYFTWEIFKPIKLFIEKDAFNMKNWFKKNVAYPLADALVPMKIMMKKMGDRILDNVLKIFQPVEKGVRVTFTTIGKKLEKIFNPVLNALSRIAKVTYNATKKLTQASILAAMAPIRLVGGLASGMIKWDAYKKGVGNAFNTMTTNLAAGDIRGTLSSGLDFAKHALRPRIDYNEDKYAKELVEYQDYAKERDAKLKAEMARGETYFASQEKQFLAEREAVRTNKYNLTEEQVKAKMADIEKRKKDANKLQAVLNGSDPMMLVHKTKIDLLTQIKEGVFQTAEHTGKTLELDERNKDDNAIQAAKDKAEKEKQDERDKASKETAEGVKALVNIQAGDKKAAEKLEKDKGFFDKLFGGGNTFTGGILDGIKSIGSGVSGLLSSAGMIALAIGALGALIAGFFDKDNPKPGGARNKMANSHGAAIATEFFGKKIAKNLGAVGSIGRGIARFGKGVGSFFKNNLALERNFSLAEFTERFGKRNVGHVKKEFDTLRGLKNFDEFKAHSLNAGLSEEELVKKYNQIVGKDKPFNAYLAEKGLKNTAELKSELSALKKMSLEDFKKLPGNIGKDPKALAEELASIKKMNLNQFAKYRNGASFEVLRNAYGSSLFIDYRASYGMKSAEAIEKEYAEYLANPNVKKKTLLGRAAAKVGEIGEGIAERGKNLLKSTGMLKSVNTLATKAAEAKGTITEAVGRNIEKAGELVNKAVTTSKEVASSVSEKFTKKLGDAIESVKNSSIAKKLFSNKKLEDFFKAIDSLAKKFADPKFYAKVMEVLKRSRISGGISKLGKLGAKIGARLGADTFTGGIAIAAFVAYDGYTGWTEAYRMFDVNPEDVDTKMKMINTFINVLFGNVPQLMFLDFALAMCSIGLTGLSDTYLGQLLAKFGFKLNGFDHRKIMCQFLYKYLATDEELDNLNDKQKELIKEYDAYINEHQDKKGMTLEEYQAEKGNLTMWEKYGAPVINRILGVTDSEGKPLPSVSEMISDQITGITNWFKKSVDYIMKLSPIGFIKETFGIPSLSELTDRVGNMISEAGSKAFGFFRGNRSYSDDEETSLNDEDEAILAKYKKHAFGGKGHSFNINGEASNKRKYHFAGGFGLGPTVPDFKIMEGDSGMPYYSQMDSRWSKTPLVAGDAEGKTIGEAGCAPTSMAMIVSRLSQTNFDPEDAAKYLDKTDLDSDGFVTPGYFAGAASAANLHGHVLQETDNQEFKNLLEKGNMMILGGKSMKPSSPFFGSGHYVVAAGLSPRNSNYALVYDPTSSGKSKEYPISDLLDQSIRNEGWGAYFDYSPYNQPGTISQKTLDAADANEDKIVIDLSDVKGTGEGQFWVKQHPGVSIDGCVKDTIATLNVLGKYFLKKYGKRLVLTAGTNGSHAGGEHSHANGWKLDVNDWGGPDGLQGQFISKNADNLADFIAFGNAIGVGMNPECWGTDSEHIDVCVDGTQWHDPNAGKNFGGFGKGTLVKNVKGLGRIRTHGKKGNGKPRRKYEKSVTGLLSFFKDSVSTAIDATIAGKKWNPLDFNQMEDFASDGTSIQNDGRTAALNEDTKENQISIWKYLTGDLHMNREGAAGVMGNLMRESGFRTSAMGDNNTSMGIAQWHNERMTNMKNYAASVGKAPTDLDAQLGYLKQELTTGYKDVYDSVKSAPSVEYSVDKWVRGFERPANMDQEVLERLPYANTVFKDHDTFAGGLRGFNSHEAKEVLSKATKLKSKKFAGGAYGFMGGSDPLGAAIVGALFGNKAKPATINPRYVPTPTPIFRDQTPTAVTQRQTVYNNDPLATAIVNSIFGIKNKPAGNKKDAALIKQEADKLGISVDEYYKIRYNSAEPIADQVAKLKAAKAEEAKLVAKQVAADSLKNIPRAPENLTGIPASQKNVPEGVPKLTNDDLKALDEIIEARKKLERRSLNKKLEAASLNTFDAFAKRNGVLYEGKINPQQNIPEVAPKKAEVVKATIKKDSDLSGGSMGELLNSVRALDTHNDLSQMISLLKVIAEKEAVTINNNQTFNAPRTAGNIDDKRVIQAMNRVAQNRNQARLGDERLKRLMDLGSNVGDLAMDQYQMAYKISQGGNFKTV